MGYRFFCYHVRVENKSLHVLVLCVCRKQGVTGIICQKTTVLDKVNSCCYGDADFILLHTERELLIMLTCFLNHYYGQLQRTRDVYFIFRNIVFICRRRRSRFFTHNRLILLTDLFSFRFNSAFRNSYPFSDHGIYLRVFMSSGESTNETIDDFYIEPYYPL